MLAALYIRVSTDEQAKFGYSLPEQEKALREYSTKNGYGVYKVYCDTETGKKESRKQLQEMLHEAKNKCFDAVIVWKFDRFSRNRAFSITTKELLRKQLKIAVLSVTEDIPDSPEGIYLEAMLEANSEFEVLRLAQRVKLGMLGRAKEGLYMGQMPYGYYVENGKVLINEDQANIVRKVFELYNGGWGHLKIARWLNDNKIPTYKGLIGSWQTFQVTQILKNEKYIGLNRWDNELYETDIPKIIDQEIFDFARIQIDKNKKQYTYRGNNYDKFLLLGLLRCGECDCQMRIKLNNAGRANPYYAYMCYNSNLYRGRCTHHKLHRHDILEKNALKILKLVINGDPNLFHVGTPKVDITKNLSDALQKNNTRLTNALNGYLDGIIPPDQYKTIKEKIDKENIEIETELLKLRADQDKIIKMAAQKKALTGWQQFKELKSIIEKKQKLMEFVSFIKVYPEKIYIEFIP